MTMKHWILFSLFCLLAAPAMAQNFSSVVATNIQDVSGSKLASGALCFDASNATNSSNDTPASEISFQAGGGGQVLREPICTPITNGAIGTFQVPNSANTIPAGVVYHVYVIQGSYHLLDYYQVSVTGTTWDFDNYNPNTPVGAAPTGASVNGPLTVNGNFSVTGSYTASVTSNTALKPPASDAIQYVSPNGSDTNDGLSWGTAKATISGAYAALPTCSIVPQALNAGGTAQAAISEKCGLIRLASNPAGYSIASELTLTSGDLAIVGIGKDEVKIDCPTAGVCIYWNNSSVWTGVNNGSYGFYNITLDGGGGTGTGIKLNDTTGINFVHVSIRNFSGSGGIGLLASEDSAGYDERMHLDGLFLDNNTTGLELATTGTNNSFGHQFWSSLQFAITGGQTAFSATGTAQLYSSTVAGIINMYPSAGTCTTLAITGTATVKGNFGFTVDNGGPCTTVANSGITSSNFQVWGWNPGNSGDFQIYGADASLDSEGTNGTQGALLFDNSGTAEAQWGLNGNNHLALAAPGTGSAGLIPPASSNYPEFQFPNVGGTFAMVLTGTTGSIGGSALTAGSCASGTVTVTGATAGMPVIASASDGSSVGGDFGLSASVTSANTVTVEVCAYIAGTPTAQTYSVRVIQ